MKREFLKRVALAGKKEWLTRFSSGTCVAWKAGSPLMLRTSQFGVGMRCDINEATYQILSWLFLGFFLMGNLVMNGLFS